MGADVIAGTSPDPDDILMIKLSIHYLAGHARCDDRYFIRLFPPLQHVVLLHYCISSNLSRTFVVLGIQFLHGTYPMIFPQQQPPVGGRKLEVVVLLWSEITGHHECILPHQARDESFHSARQFPLRVFHFNFVNNSAHVKILPNGKSTVSRGKMSHGHVCHRFVELISPHLFDIGRRASSGYRNHFWSLWRLYGISIKGEAYD